MIASIVRSKIQNLLSQIFVMKKEKIEFITLTVIYTNTLITPPNTLPHSHSYSGILLVWVGSEN
jgi:hypothetical protein